MDVSETIELADASFERCQAVPGFLRDFYNRFLTADPRIAPMFKDTEFERQTRLLQHALGLLLACAKGSSETILDRVAERHSVRDLDIPADLFPIFVDTLVETIAANDPEFDEAVGRAWREVLAPGVSYMIAKHG